MNPRHLTHDEQAQALAAWGRGGSFRCVACGEECANAVSALSVPTSFPGFALSTCFPCARRFRQSPKYRRQTAERARMAGYRAVGQRVADLVGVSESALTETIRKVSTRCPPGPAAFRLVDAALGLPAGSVDGALLTVLNCGGKQ